MQPSDIAPRDRLIVALDLPGVAKAEAMIARLGDRVTFYKIGYQLGFAGGLPLVRQLAGAGKKVFADLKLHDIANTVTGGVESAAEVVSKLLVLKRPLHVRLDVGNSVLGCFGHEVGVLSNRVCEGILYPTCARS